MKIFPFAPDWGTQPKLTWVWRTAVAPALDQSETRIALASRSFFKFEFQVGAFTQEEAERLQLWLNSVDASQDIAVPLWTDSLQLLAPAGLPVFGLEAGDEFSLENGDLFGLEAAEGITVSVADTTGYLFTRGTLLLWSDYKTFEAVALDSVTASVLTVSLPVASYSIGDTAVPLLIGNIHLSQKGALVTDELLRVAVQFEENTASPQLSNSTLLPQLAGLLFALPSLGAVSANSCSCAPTSTDTVTFSGQPGRTYLATFRVRGVVEQKTYVGGATAGYVNTGGAPAGDSFNIYQLTISDPPQVLYLNAGTSGIGNCFALDYTVQAEVRGGATLTLYAASLDALEILNIDPSGTPLSVADDPSFPIVVTQPYDGQFLQIDCLSLV